jgi:ankyrin repeat protein
MTAKLTHRDLINLGKLLNYQMDSRGLCRGFSGMLIQAWLAQDERAFFARVKFIESYKKNFNKLKDDIDNARKLAKRVPFENLNEKTRQLLEIPAFYEGIVLFLKPRKYAPLFNKNITQTEVESIAYFTSPNVLHENEGMTVVFKKSYAYSKQELLTYLTELEKQLENTDVIAPMFFSSLNHAICAKYDPNHQQWVFVDINDFVKYPNYDLYYTPLPKEKLVDRIFQSFSGSVPSNYTMFTTTVVARRNESSDLKRAFSGLAQQFPISAELIEKSNQHNLNLLSSACVNGEVEMVEAILKLDNIRVNQVNKNGVSPLYFACQNGNVRIVQALLNREDIRVNQAQKNGATPLMVACADGNLGIVQELLKHPKIKVNKGNDIANPIIYACISGNHEIVDELLKHEVMIQTDPNGLTLLHHACEGGHTEVVHSLLTSSRQLDINARSQNGMTPLMQACESQKTHNKKSLFQYLLQQGASVTTKSDKGERALDFALKMKNSSAVEAIFEHAVQQKIRIRSIVSENNYREYHHLILAYEEKIFFFRLLEKANELIREGERLLEKKSQITNMTTKEKEKYLSEINRYQNRIEVSGIFSPYNKSNLPEFNDKANLLNVQKGDIEQIKEDINNELSALYLEKLKRDEILRSEMLKLVEKYCGNYNGAEGIFTTHLKALEETNFWQDYFNNWASYFLQVPVEKTEFDLCRDYIYRLEFRLRSTLPGDYDQLLDYVDEGISMFKGHENETGKLMVSILPELQEDIRKLKAISCEGEGAEVSTLESPGIIDDYKINPY